MNFHKNMTPINTPFNEYIPILIFIGIIGTIISITDPFGRLAKFLIYVLKRGGPLDITNVSLRYKVKYNVKTRSKLEDPIWGDIEMEPRLIYHAIRRIVNSNWINYEIDKLVSNFYFIITLIFLIFILVNPDDYKVYMDFVSLNLNSTVIAKDSQQSINEINLYSELRIPILILFFLSLIGLIVIFYVSCKDLSPKIEILNYYFLLNDKIDIQIYSDQKSLEISNLNKYFLDYINAHDWIMASEILNRMLMTVEHTENNKSHPKE